LIERSSSKRSREVDRVRSMLRGTTSITDRDTIETRAIERVGDSLEDHFLEFSPISQIQVEY
jgi:hypothetical protein